MAHAACTMRLECIVHVVFLSVLLLYLCVDVLVFLCYCACSCVDCACGGGKSLRGMMYGQYHY